MAFVRPSMSPERPPERSYVYAFGAVGLAGGLFTSLVFGRVPSGIGMLMAATTMLASAGVGLAFAKRTNWLLSSVAFGVLGGMVNGFLLALCLAAGPAALFGMVLGGLCAVPFVPALAFMAYEATKHGRARAGTLLSAIDRRGLARAAAISVVCGGLVLLGLLRKSHGGLTSTRFVGGVELLGLLVLLGIAAADLRAFAVLRVARRLAPSLRRVEPNALSAPEPGPAALDVGVGVDFHLREEGAFTFRSAPRVEVAVIGDPWLAQRCAARVLALDGAGLFVAVATLAGVLGRV